MRLTLDKMARGGIYDHLGGGFARYSTDERWLVPHFEKMLYDNALLGSTYLEAYQLTRRPRVRAGGPRDVRLRSRPDDESRRRVLFATEDADSEGVEGKFYVWTLDELIAVLGPERGEDVRVRLRRDSAGATGKAIRS